MGLKEEHFLNDGGCGDEFQASYWEKIWQERKRFSKLDKESMNQIFSQDRVAILMEWRLQQVSSSICYLEDRHLIYRSVPHPPAVVIKIIVG